MKLYYFIFITILPILSFAQVKEKKDWDYDVTDNSFAPKRTYISLLYSLPNGMNKNWDGFSKNGNYSSTTIGPAGLHIEYSAFKQLGLTFQYQAMNTKASWSQGLYDTATKLTTYNDKGFNYLGHTIAAGIHNHAFANKTIDLFLGAQLGYTIHNYKLWSKETLNPTLPKPKSISPFFYYGYFGGRLFFHPRVAFTIQAGISNLWNVQSGLVFRFGY